MKIFPRFIPAICAIFSSLVFAEKSATSSAPTIKIHIDNPSDYAGLSKTGDFKPGITIDSNLLAIESTGMKIKYSYMTLKRSMIYMNQGQPICVTDRVKTPEREAKYLFSKPVNLFVSRRLYYNDKGQKLDELTNNAPVDLVSLFKNNKDLTLLLSNQISYGKQLDNIIEHVPKRSRTYRDGAAHDFGIINMFAKNRADFTLLYPQQVFGYSVEISAKNYEIAGIKPYVTGHLMCSNTTVMRNFINTLNKQLERLYANGKLLEAHLKYLRPQDADALKKYFFLETKIN